MVARPQLVLYSALIGFVAFNAAEEVLRFWAFRTYAWDLGLSNQAYYTTLYDHRFFYYTADLPSGFSGSLALGAHFSPFLALLLPFYAVWPSPSTLVVLQWVGLALGALPLYALARTETHSAKVAVALGVLYLISPVTAATGWYDFHPEAFIPLTVLTTIFLYRTRRWRLFLGSWALALTVTEPVAILLGIFAVSTLVALLALDRATPFTQRIRRPETVALVVGIAMAVAWLGLAYLVILNQNPGGGVFGVDFSAFWSVLGATSIAQVLPVAVLHPGNALAALGFGGPLKAGYVAILFGSVGFLCFAGRLRYLFPVLGWLSLALLSNNPAYYSLGSQYTGYVLPFLFAGVASGIAYIIQSTPTAPGVRREEPELRRGGQRRHRLVLPAGTVGRQTLIVVGLVVVGLVASSAVSSPLLAKPYFSFGDAAYGLTGLTPHAAMLHRIMDLIPAQASVLTSNALFPELSSRPDAYVVPFASFFAGNRTFPGVLASYVAEVNYVLFDYQIDPSGAWAITSVSNFSGFGVLAEAGGIVLYERGWTGNPAIYSPMNHTYSGGSLRGFAPGERVFPLNPKLGSGLSVPPEPNGTWLLNGPDLGNVPPGTYRVTFNITLSSHPSGPLLRLASNQTPLVLESTVVNPSSAGQDYKIRFGHGANSTVNSTDLSTTAPSFLPENYSISFEFPWGSPAIWFANIQELSPYVTFILSAVQLTQLGPG